MFESDEASTVPRPRPTSASPRPSRPARTHASSTVIATLVLPGESKWEDPYFWGGLGRAAEATASFQAAKAVPESA